MRSSERPHTWYSRKSFMGWIALALLPVFILLWVAGLKQGTQIAVKEKIRQFFEARLIFPDPPDVAGSEQETFKGEGRSVIYVLGGTANSFRFKFHEAARLYHGGRAPTIMVMHTDTSTDEWSLRQLTHLGVAPQDVLFIHIDAGFFGTLSEARALADVIAEMKIRTLLLVCSDYHGSRVSATFSALLRPEDVRLEIHGVDEPMRILGLLIEYVKLQAYTHIVLPHAKMSAAIAPMRYGLPTLMGFHRQ